MHSEILHIGPFTVRAFGLLMALGFLAAAGVAWRLSRGTHRNADYFSTLVMWLMLAGLAGGRVAYVAEHWTDEFAGSPGALFRIDQGGLMFYGGLAGAALAVGLFARLRDERFFSLTDLLLTVLPLGHAFGRLGCFMHGCCHGRVVDGFPGISFPRGSPPWVLQVDADVIPESALRSLPVIPTQLIEAAANLALFFILVRMYRRHRDRTGRVTAAYLMGYAVIRFGVESLRGDPRQTVGPFSISQAISLAACAAGFVLWIVLRREPDLQTRAGSGSR